MTSRCIEPSSPSSHIHPHHSKNEHIIIYPSHIQSTDGLIHISIHSSTTQILTLKFILDLGNKKIHRWIHPHINPFIHNTNFDTQNSSQILAIKKKNPPLCRCPAIVVVTWSRSHRRSRHLRVITPPPLGEPTTCIREPRRPCRSLPSRRI